VSVDKSAPGAAAGHQRDQVSTSQRARCGALDLYSAPGADVPYSHLLIILMTDPIRQVVESFTTIFLPGSGPRKLGTPLLRTFFTKLSFCSVEGETSVPSACLPIVTTRPAGVLASLFVIATSILNL
jgi:hypothetical protein